MSQRNSAMMSGSIYSNTQSNLMKKSSSTFKFKDRESLGNDNEHQSSSDSSSTEDDPVPREIRDHSI